METKPGVHEYELGGALEMEMHAMNIIRRRGDGSEKVTYVQISHFL